MTPAMMTADHRASAFGLMWESDIALDGFDPVCAARDDDAQPADVRVARTAMLANRGAGRPVNLGWVYPNGVRLTWRDEVAFDMIGGDRIDYLPGPGWRGALPPAFYSTVAALTLAWRGTIPLHACTVEVDGYAVLIAGRSGAGKSSLTAGLLRVGARLVADDLSAVCVKGARVTALRGRPTMRQHREMAAVIDADLRAPIADDPRDKWLVRPRARSHEQALPLAGLLALSERNDTLDIAARIALLGTHLFRPRWLAAMPGHARRRRDLLAIAALPVESFPAIATFDPQDQQPRAERALARIRTMIAHCADRV